MRLAYLATKYPAVSHTFIRRELREIERRGHSVLRVSIRPPLAAPVDPVDLEELASSVHILAQPIHRLLFGAAATAMRHPIALVRTLALAIGMSWRSDRGLIRHLAYVFEAAYLRDLFAHERIEHVHVHFADNPAAVARLVRRLGGPPYSLTVHGIEAFDAPEPTKLAGKVQDAAFTISVSDYGSAQIRRWVEPQYWPSIHVVHCTVNDNFTRAAEPILPSSKTLVCVGRLAREKGHLVLLEALAEAVRRGADARLVLAGDGELRPMIEARTRELGLNERVEITGYLSEVEVRERILAARALVLPSFAEGLPMVIMEAFALGRPVISTYVGGIPELVRPGENGWLVPAGNVAELAAVLVDAIRAPISRLEQMGARGRALVLERHVPETEIPKLDALLRASGRAGANARNGLCTPADEEAIPIARAEAPPLVASAAHVQE
jgi:colanic acid/amylovoran biosynthesis glycosyltransferase